MKGIVFSCFLFVIVFLYSCGSDKAKVGPVYVDMDIADTDIECGDEMEYGEESYHHEEVDTTNDIQNVNEVIEIPFRNVNGVKYVDVKVNGVGFEMIFDTGCSGALISAAEANYLYQKGKLTQEDILGISASQIADGSIVENMIVNLKEVVINDRIYCLNVKATVINNNNAPLLLGNEVLDRVATIEIDNENQTLNFRLK